METNSIVKQMPISIEAEQALLGSLIINPESFDKVAGFISVNDFYLDEHKHIYSALVKMYLSGELGKTANDVDAYCASTLFAADRFASFRKDWHKDFEDPDTIIVADRYVSSNMIHQAGKIEDLAEKEKFLDWLFDFEFNLYKLPQPDITIFLDMPPEFGRKLMEGRDNKFSGDAKLDIHENDFSYLEKSYENAKYVSEKFGWKHVLCVENGEIRTIDTIQNEIRSLTEKIL